MKNFAILPFDNVEFVEGGGVDEVADTQPLNIDSRLIYIGEYSDLKNIPNIFSKNIN